MSIERVGLQKLLESENQIEKIEKFLKTFKSNFATTNEVEYFLHNNAIEFEKKTLSTTHLLINENNELVGYFSIANKKLNIPKEVVKTFSKTKLKKIGQSSNIKKDGSYEINSYLIGQLGINFSQEIKGEKITGKDLLNEIWILLLEAKKLVNVKYIWLECENNSKLINFYKEFGFDLIDGFENDLKVMFMKI
ncbi:N-acetyltransferase [Leptotrichia trevisanii]|uniref:N-acetyltransferase n=1 Tax=Leptotrichia trevisanii TaxID=109328 RepID=UPI000424A18B|nr:N-acetyltransferase [Leptotrichia trevisanii]